MITELLTTKMPIIVNSHCLSFWLSSAGPISVLFSVRPHHEPELVNLCRSVFLCRSVALCMCACARLFIDVMRWCVCVCVGFTYVCTCRRQSQWLINMLNICSSSSAHSTIFQSDCAVRAEHTSTVHIYSTVLLWAYTEHHPGVIVWA